MAALVTEEEALRQLRMTTPPPSDEEVADVMFKAAQASDIVVDYLKRPPFAPTYPALDPPEEPPDPWTDETCPTLVKAAILIVLTSLYDGRTPLDELLSENVTGILWRWRDPALA